ncbi:MAG TPA: glucosaminidase domain-containing protein [Gammaproteobacteria bacterium]|nr:glucosaminidase domain-containing protein [Gammaproteobacteria bacterium]
MTTAALPRERLQWWHFGLIAIPLAVAIAVGAHLRSSSGPAPLFEEPRLQPVTVNDARALGPLFAGLGYGWLPDGRVPALELQRFPANMAALPVDIKKQVFFQALLPMVVTENRQIARQRTFVLAQFAESGERDSAAQDTLDAIAKHYGVQKPLSEPAARRQLLRRLDTVPPALVLAQAAKESGWGTSRFAREANNLFGMWTWNADAGLAPRQADEDADHYVRIFADLRASVRGYLYNINVGHAYLELRKMRAKLRAAGKAPTAIELAEALERYSAHGTQYVDAVQRLIRRNELTKLRGTELQLAPLELVAEK